MKLAVMMAAWNAEAYISYSIASILSQGADIDLDVIVIDDGSTDKTGQILDQLAAKDERLRIIHTANQGVTRARNEALRALTPDTDLVTFLDADDLVPQGRYQRDIELFQQDPELSLTFGNTVLFKVADEMQLAPAIGAETCTIRTIQLAAGTYRYKLFQAVGEFDTSFKQAEDMDFMLRILETAPPYMIIHEPCLYYRRHSSNMTHNSVELRRDFARALMMSIKRRKAGVVANYPPDLFDANELMKASQW